MSTQQASTARWFYNLKKGGVVAERDIDFLREAPIDFKKYEAPFNCWHCGKKIVNESLGSPMGWCLECKVKKEGQ